MVEGVGGAAEDQDPTSAGSPGSTPGPELVARPPTGPSGWRSRIWEAADVRHVPLATILATVGVVVAAGLALVLLWVLRTEVLYVVVASFIAILLTPPVHLLERRGMSRGVASTLVFLGGVLVFAGIVYLFGSPLVSAVTKFAHQVPTLVTQAEHGRGQIGRLVQRLHLQHWVDKNAPKLSNVVANISKPALSIGAAAASTLIALGTIAVLSFFILLEGPGVAASLLGMLPPERAARTVRVWRQVTRSVSGYMLGNALTSVVAGLVVFVTLTVLHVPFATLLALWVALVDLLPLVGGLLAGVPVVIIALLHSPVAGFVTLAVFLIYQQIENHVLNPVIMSRTVRLNPLWVLLAVLVGAKLGERVGSGLGAFVGALIGIPVGGAIQVIVLELRRGPSAPGAEPGPGKPAPVP